MENKTLKIGETYITIAGDIRKLVRIENDSAYFENLSKYVYDGWEYEEDGTYCLDLKYCNMCIIDGDLKVYEG